VNGFNKTAFGRGVGEPAGKLSKNYADADGYETVGAWDCAEDCPVRLLDEQSGELKSGELSQANYPDTSPRRLFEFCYGDGWRKIVARHYFPNRGGASRFFYCAKVSRRERTADGTVENREPTVKPVALGRYLIRLVTPPGGLVLDPFCGSGSFGVAAIFEGFNWIGIDNRFEACEIAKKRCEWAIKRKNLEQPKLL
jgi:site-specific DNA-methyltransferase (adenine-specific)